MKLALVKQRYSLRHGGSERYCVNLARALKRLGHEVTVIGERIDAELAGEIDFRPVRVNRLTSWAKNRSFAENCGQVAHTGGFDIVYGLGRSYGLDAVRVTERLQLHWVNVYYRNPVQRFAQRLNPRHRTLIGLERAIYHSDRVRRIVTQSRLDRQLLVEHYGVPDDKIRTIYNGVDTTTFHPGLRAQRRQVREELGIGADDPLLLFASMDFEGKGLRSILQAIARSRHRDLRLLVLGTGPVRKFQSIARELGLERRVLFGGRRGDIQRCYGAADLFLLPTAYEPFPNVNLEALACGLPALTTRTAGGADVIATERNGYLIAHVRAVDEITGALDRHFALNDAERERMREHCWSAAKTMTVEKNVAETVKLFEEVLVEKFRV